MTTGLKKNNLQNHINRKTGTDKNPTLAYEKELSVKKEQRQAS